MLRINVFAEVSLPWVLAGVILLSPVLFVPGLASSVMLPKAMLLLLGAAFALLLCLLRNGQHRGAIREVFRPRAVWFAAAYVFFATVSAVFSAESSEAFLGSGGIAPRTVASLTAFFVLFLVTASLRDAGSRRLLTRALVFAPVLPVALTSAAFLGFSPQLLLVNGTIAGSYSALLLLAAAGLVAALAAATEWEGGWRIGATGVALLHVAFGVLAYTQLAWIAVSIGGIAVLAVLLKKDTTGATAGPSVYLPAFIVGFGILFALGVPSPVRFAIPPTAAPTFDATYEVTKASFAEKPLFGYGPGQFAHAYVKHMPDEIARTSFWDVRFSAGSSELTTLSSEVGIFGKLAWLLFMAMLLFGVFRRGLSRSRAVADPMIFLPAAGLFVTALAGQATYFLSSLALAPLMWISAGLLVMNYESRNRDQNKEKEFDATGDEGAEQQGNGRSQGMAVLTAFASILLLVTLAFAATRFSASALAQRGMTALARGDAVQARDHLARAVSLAPGEPLYWQRLADAAMTQLLHEAEKGDEADVALMRELAQDAQAAVLEAAAQRSETAAVWAQVARTNAELSSFALEDAASLAVTAWDRALELDPNHPGYLTERGSLRLSLLEVSGAEAGEEMLRLLEEARADFQRAVELRPQFAPAHYHLALTAGAVGNTEEAITATENALRADPQHVGYGLQLGLLYMDANRNEDASAIFEQILMIEPEYANARYYLMILQARAGAANAALEHLDRLLEQSPDEDLLVRIRENIADGQDPLAGLENTGDGEDLPEPIEP